MILLKVTWKTAKYIALNPWNSMHCSNQIWYQSILFALLYLKLHLEELANKHKCLLLLIQCDNNFHGDVGLFSKKSIVSKDFVITRLRYTSFFVDTMRQHWDQPIHSLYWKQESVKFRRDSGRMSMSNHCYTWHSHCHFTLPFHTVITITAITPSMSYCHHHHTHRHHCHHHYFHHPSFIILCHINLCLGGCRAEISVLRSHLGACASLLTSQLIMLAVFCLDEKTPQYVPILQVVLHRF